MGRITLNERTNLSKVDIDFTQHNQILVVGTSGSGKSMLIETIIHRAWKQGCVIISLTDVKDEFELAFAQFEPDKDYHIEKLEKWGIPKEKIPVKIYHPFTFNIPHSKLPEITLYTIPIKSLTRTELQYIAETSTDKTSIKMFLEAQKKLKKTDGIHHLIFYLQQMIEENQEEGKYSTNPEEFYAKGKRGTEKQMTELFGYFDPYKTDYSLTPQECKLNINIEEIINDKEHYHLLSTKWIKDPKQKAFYILNLLIQIEQTISDKAKHPIVIVIDELAIVCPEKTEGYTVILSEEFGKALKTVRSKGRGVSTIGGTQEYFSVSREITGSSTERILGRLSVQDRNNLSKAIRIKTEELNTISNLTIGEFVIEHIGFQTPIKAWMPPHAHKEPTSKYTEKYSEEHPEKLKKYTEETEYIKEIKKRTETEVLEIVKEENKKAKQKEQEKQQKKEEKKQEKTEKITKQKEEIKELKEEQKKQIYNKYKEYKAIGIKKSLRDIAKEYDIKLSNGEPDAMKIQRIITKYQKEEEKQEQ